MADEFLVVKRGEEVRWRMIVIVMLRWAKPWKFSGIQRAWSRGRHVKRLMRHPETKNDERLKPSKRERRWCGMALFRMLAIL
jgi:hypothetical protein